MLEHGANASSESGTPRRDFNSRLLESRDALAEIGSVVEGLAEQVAVVSRRGIILAVNKAWRRQVERQARSGLAISRDYDAFLAGLVAEGDAGAEPILSAFRDICAGRRQSFSCVYHGVGSFSGYDFRVLVRSVSVRGEDFVLVSVEDITKLTSLRLQRRRLASQLLRAQENERRRMARDLHDSTSQSLVALQLELMRFEGEDAGPRAEAIVAGCRSIVQDIHKEIRALSFMAHPPSLETNSLQAALESLVTGFANRTGLAIDVECSDVGEASASVQATLFRIAQEALANVHRHALATHAHVRLIGRPGYLHLLILDNGMGFDLKADIGRQRYGVGVLGMMERVQDLSGRLSFRRWHRGTLLRVTLPRRKRTSFSEGASGF
jgi:signal transduction histidine kinase